MMFKRATQIISFAVVLSFSATVRAEITLSFFSVTNTIAEDVEIGVAQMFVTVSDAGDGQALFLFENIGPAASSITDTYFDDGVLLGIAQVDNSDVGVSFTEGASPGNLPGGNNADPEFEAATSTGYGLFLADSDPSVQHNGVNPGESLGITFNLVLGGTFAQLISDLTTGVVRVGIHVQGFDSEGSEGFVNHPIPAPAAALLGAIGLGMVGWMRRRLA